MLTLYSFLNSLDFLLLQVRIQIIVGSLTLIKLLFSSYDYCWITASPEVPGMVLSDYIQRVANKLNPGFLGGIILTICSSLASRALQFSQILDLTSNACSKPFPEGSILWVPVKRDFVPKYRTLRFHPWPLLYSNDF
jgi:hypothetical protein